MCGLAGILQQHGTSPSDLGRVVGHMADALRHRGPDDDGTWVDAAAGVALGFRRLAILDLSEAGHQPMRSPDGRLALVFNGEIYNHAELREELSRADSSRPWRGHSDTETLLAAFARWGVGDTLQRTVGMFALALWDSVTRRLYLARDRFGEKPLYYGWTRGGVFLFASELAAIRKHPGFDNGIDRDALSLFLQYRAVPAPWSIYERVYKLEPGCVLTLDATRSTAPADEPPSAPYHGDGLTIERYWSATESACRAMADPITDEVEAVDRLEAVLLDAVRHQSIADVPLGAFLSGGVDSSCIVALMQAGGTHRTKTFTVGFDEAGFNEADHARAVAQHLGTDHVEVFLSAAETRAAIPLLPAIYSEPFADSSQLATHLVAQVARRSVTVALSGDGGDELFGGYNRHLWSQRVWDVSRRLPGPLQRGTAALIRRVPVSTWDAMGRVLPPQRRLSMLGDKAHKIAIRLQPSRTLDEFYRRLVTTTWADGENVVRGARRGGSPSGPHRRIATTQVAPAFMIWDTIGYLPDDILHKVDRAAMGVSLETRAPYLDHRVAEMAWRLPMDMKVRDGVGKWALRQVLYRYVPAALIERPKMGFAVPIDRWLRGPLRDWAEDLLSERRLTDDGLFRVDAIRQKWSEHLSGSRNWSDELWCVLMFQAWRGAGR